MTDSLGEYLLKPTSLDVVDADSCADFIHLKLIKLLLVLIIIYVL